MKLENLLPKDGPSINEVNKYIDKYKNDLIVVKCGGSCLLDKDLFDQLIEALLPQCIIWMRFTSFPNKVDLIQLIDSFLC